MSDYSRILILGTGPASVQLAVLFRSSMPCLIGIAGRASLRSASFFDALQVSGGIVRVSVRNEHHRRLAGICDLDRIYCGYGTVEGGWDTVVLAVTADAYLPVLKQLGSRVLREAKRVLLLSPAFGSGAIVRSYLSGSASDAEVISFSTYLGDTRWADGKPSDRVVTAGVKRKVFAGSTHGCTDSVKSLIGLFGQAGIALTAVRSTCAAEMRNLSLYVHPPFLLNEYALETVFGNGGDAPRYVYKLYPEGPVTMKAIADMAAHWREMTALVERLGLPGLNLLKFMTDDNYPVRPDSLPRDAIERFPSLEAIHQQYLLYVRYASLLIDPYAEPDRDGRYPDFSAVPIRRIRQDAEGRWEIPRMPKEDYYRIKIVQGIARMAGTDTPTIDRFIAAYEARLLEAARTLSAAGERLSDDFTVRDFEEEIRLAGKAVMLGR